MTQEKKYSHQEVIKENEFLFARLNWLTSDLFSKNAKLIGLNLALNSQIKELNATIQEQQNQIFQLREKLRKQENIEKKQEIQKESVKIVSRNINQSIDNLELKQTIADLIIEIDECVALLDEQELV